MFTVDVPGRIDPAFIAPLLTVGSNASQSEYRGVYQYPKGGWVARVRSSPFHCGRAPLKNISGVVQSPTQAAYILAKWYEDLWQDDWRPAVLKKAVLGRWSKPFEAMYSESKKCLEKFPKFQGLYSWVVCVWERGKPLPMTKLEKDGSPTKRPELFPSQRSALAYFPDWCQRRYGENAERVLYRL